MATGDIVKFGTLLSNGNRFKQKTTLEIYNGAYRNMGFDSNDFTFVDALNEEEKWTWIEANIDIGKIYICTSILSAVGSYNSLLSKIANKIIQIEGKTYQLVFLTKEQIEEQVPLNVANMIDFAENTGKYVEAYTCTTQRNVIQYNDNLIKNAVYMCHFMRNEYEPNGIGHWVHAEANSTYPNDTTYEGNYNYMDAEKTSATGGFLPILKLVNSTPTISGEDEDLGDKTSAFNITYSVNDNDVADELTVTEKLNEKIIKTLYDYVIIPDVRFPNEIDKMCDNFNCITVRVIRPDFDNGLTDEQKNHPSETALKDYPMEYELINDGDLKKLLETTRTFLKNIG